MGGMTLALVHYAGARLTHDQQLAVPTLVPPPRRRRDGRKGKEDG